MIPVPTGVKVWIATGVTDLRRGMNGLTLQVQEALKREGRSLRLSRTPRRSDQGALA
jgi:hypothetical protein